MSLIPPEPPVEIPMDARTVLARKGSLRRAKPARPCALRAVLAGWNCDGRLRRDKRSSFILRPKTRSENNAAKAFTQNRPHFQMA